MKKFFQIFNNTTFTAPVRQFDGFVILSIKVLHKKIYIFKCYVMVFKDIMQKIL